jgi:arsenate reductase-like glutaredoxin family protein|tara:strand:- start:148 stop:408 length:261 start_codon:yes stop_codon:yes gene_type:complete
VEIVSYGNANKEKLDQEEVERLLVQVKKVKVAKGKKILTFDNLRNEHKQILDSILGRSGTLRSPTLQIGDQLIVGYNEELYQNLQQ